MSSAAYRAAHREERNAYGKAFYAAHREELLVKMRAYQYAKRGGPPKVASGVPEKERQAAYRATHRQYFRDKVRAWEAAHPEVVRERARANNARRRGAQDCDHPACLVIGATALAWQTNEHVCWMCGAPVFQGGNLHMDHVIPISKGGLHCADNLRPACGPCNLRKGAALKEGPVSRTPSPATVELSWAAFSAREWTDAGL